MFIILTNVLTKCQEDIFVIRFVTFGIKFTVIEKKTGYSLLRIKDLSASLVHILRIESFFVLNVDKHAELLKYMS